MAEEDFGDSSDDEWVDVPDVPLPSSLFPHSPSPSHEKPNCNNLLRHAAAIEGDPDQAEERVITIVMPKDAARSVAEKEAAFAEAERAQKKEDREMKRELHKTHLLCLLSVAMNLSRLCDENVLQVMMKSLLPEALSVRLDGLSNPRQNGIPFPLLQDLAGWFTSSFALLSDDFFLAHSELEGRGDEECISHSSSNVYLKHEQLERAIFSRCGSRDVLCILFIALCRGLCLSARLVVSLAPVPLLKPKSKSILLPNPQSWFHMMWVEVFTADSFDISFFDDVVSSSSKKKKCSMHHRDQPKAYDVVLIASSDSSDERSDTQHEESSSFSLNSFSGSTLTKRFDRTTSTHERNPERVKNPHFGLRDDDSGESPRRWVSVDCCSANTLIDKDSSFERAARAHFSYVLGIDNFAHVRDLTSKYAREWQSKTRRRRIDEQWWQEVLIYHAPPDMRGWEEEEDLVEVSHVQQAIPSSFAALKDHALYVLRRHLKANEFLLPDAEVVGMCKGEQVYLRSAVSELKSANAWLREGRVLLFPFIEPARRRSSSSLPSSSQQLRHRDEASMSRVMGNNEDADIPLNQNDGNDESEERNVQSLKRKKSLRHRANRKSRKIDEEKEDASDAESTGRPSNKDGLYGFFQTKPYSPPMAEAGIVPKNEYGHVDLFTRSMLPIGCVHLNLPGLAKLAQGLKIDYAHAVVGFEHMGGRSIPVKQGIVVCEEFGDVLKDAYVQQTQIQLERGKDEVWSRWGRLLHKVLIKLQIQKEREAHVGANFD